MDSNGGGGLPIIVSVVYFAIILLMIVSMWRIFDKAGKPGWASIIPIYNLIVLLEIVDKPLWWFVLMLIPIVNIVITLLVLIALAERFDKGAGFGVGMFFLPFIFLPILAFTD